MIPESPTQRILSENSLTQRQLPAGSCAPSVPSSPIPKSIVAAAPAGSPSLQAVILRSTSPVVSPIVSASLLSPRSSPASPARPSRKANVILPADRPFPSLVSHVALAADALLAESAQTAPNGYTPGAAAEASLACVNGLALEKMKARLLGGSVQPPVCLDGVAGTALQQMEDRLRMELSQMDVRLQAEHDVLAAKVQQVIEVQSAMEMQANISQETMSLEVQESRALEDRLLQVITFQITEGTRGLDEQVQDVNTSMDKFAIDWNLRVESVAGCLDDWNRRTASMQARLDEAAASDAELRALISGLSFIADIANGDQPATNGHLAKPCSVADRVELPDETRLLLLDFAERIKELADDSSALQGSLKENSSSLMFLRQSLQENFSILRSEINILQSQMPQGGSLTNMAHLQLTAGDSPKL